MKTKYLMLVAVTIFMALPIYGQEVYLSASEYPEEMNAYVNEHFPDDEIVSIKQDKELLKTEYEVQLKNRVELEFDGKFSVQKIEGKSPLPNGVIPSQIRDYVTKNYPNNTIFEWKREKNGQKVELNNELELIFNSNGEFLGIDD